ncbi:hypothetical protein QQY24_20200 [Streptomyces sp. TG1A-8]|uniref:hypothetical protein n=1 Tax=Streptomyces sp. TG1A-8 TaxID=3051385 RepID=UPI00265B8BF9|nr:hypothetical protein [Streptomyces sp. TG1A-8]MDO0927618.1 hypothetical protein [Streptomyces sp. TG1A-8]
MRDTTASLGPLQRNDGRWELGHSRRPGGGAWVEFREEGLTAHARDGAEEVLPWPRILLGIDVVVGKGSAKGENISPAGLLGGLPGPLSGHFGGRLLMTLRRPHENRAVYFDRHPRWYRVTDVHVLETFLRHLVATGDAHRLADPAWLDRVVTRLTGHRMLTSRRAVQRAVAEAARGS